MILNIAVGVIFNSINQILIAKRPAGKPLAGFWEFPGGKIEDNEKPYDALCRELAEEVSIEVKSAQQWMNYSHEYEEATVNLDIWQVKEFNGDAFGKEQQEIKWVRLEELTQYQFPAANEKIIQGLMINIQ